MDDRWISLEDLAALSGESLDDLMRWVQQRKLPQAQYRAVGEKPNGRPRWEQRWHRASAELALANLRIAMTR